MNLLFFSPQPPKDPSESSAETEDFFATDGENVNYIVHLNDTTFDGFITENSEAPILTMFYAHCKYISSRRNSLIVLF